VLGFANGLEAGSAAEAAIPAFLGAGAALAVVVATTMAAVAARSLWIMFLPEGCEWSFIVSSTDARVSQA
jgi:hypothetical protein